MDGEELLDEELMDAGSDESLDAAAAAAAATAAGNGTSRPGSAAAAAAAAAAGASRTSLTPEEEDLLHQTTCEDVSVTVAGKKNAIRGKVWRARNGDYLRYRCIDTGSDYRPGGESSLISTHSPLSFLLIIINITLPFILLSLLVIVVFDIYFWV